MGNRWSWVRKIKGKRREKEVRRRGEKKRGELLMPGSARGRRALMRSAGRMARRRLIMFGHLSPTNPELAVS
jgi:hypothetical protein